MKVFISHSSKDKKFVRTLKDCLNENSIDTWLDEDQLDLGDSLINKLENALNTSSHLVIVLSPASVESDWVKYELKKALSNQRTGLIQKIIPIKYRECNIPEELSDILYGDLSDEVVLPNTDSDRIKFISNGFEGFFLKLVRAIRNTTKAISKSEKEEIVKSIKSTEEIIEKHSHSIHRGNYELIGFNTPESRLKYQKQVFNKGNAVKNIQELRPFLLPISLKGIFEVNFGEKIQIESDYPYKSYGHFAGFRIDDLKIAIDQLTRDELFIKVREYYQVEVDLEERIIRFVSNINPRKTKVVGENSFAMAA